jgi:acyl-CoA reductase-like NAD-dependent aldehyde dehydrogenase
MDAIADRLAARMDELTALQVKENGATVRAAGAFLIGYAIAHLKHFASVARSYAFETTGPLIEAPTLAAGLLLREPVGGLCRHHPVELPAAARGVEAWSGAGRR